jgi:hypothetical protein
MWDSATIFLTDYISAEEFNKACRDLGGKETTRRLDPPNEDQIDFIFFGNGENATKVVRLRDNEIDFYQSILGDYEEQITMLGDRPGSFLEIEILDKRPSTLGLLNFYRTSALIMRKWQSVLSNLNSEALNLHVVEKRILELGQ